MKKILLAPISLVYLIGIENTYGSVEPSGILAKNPVPSPSGTEVVFEADYDGPQNLWIIGIDGRIGRKLTQGPSVDEEAAWSPDGKWIAFASTSSGTADLWSIQPDGSNLSRLTENSLNNRQPAWSPDGKQIAFVSDRAGSNDIWIMSKDGGSSPRRLTTLAGEENHPSFSPNGDQIVFSETTGDTATLMLMNIDGNSPPTTLTTGTTTKDWNPSWSINGIMFSSNRDLSSEHWKIWMIQPNGSNMHKVGDIMAVDPVFLPDGRIIFSDEFSNQPSDKVLSAISAFNPSNGTKIAITSDARPNQPPIAKAGPDQTVKLGVNVVLNGSESADPDASPKALSYAWSQLAGPNITLSNPTSALPSFIPIAPGKYEFSLTVNDGATSSVVDTVSITVEDVPVFMISPNGGEIWKVKTAQNVTWYISRTLANQRKAVSIQLSKNGGKKWVTIKNIKMASALTGGFTFNPKPSNLSNQARVQICAASIAKRPKPVCDSSDRNFVIQK